MEATSAPRPHAFRLPKPRKVLAALSDEKLVDYVRRGDSVAFEVLYDRHSPGILGFCRHMLRSAEDAEDAVQHTFIAAHADLQRRPVRDLHFKAWVYTIARNRCLSTLRARRDRPSEDVEAAGDSLNDHVAQRADLRALLADIHKLPDDQREALVLAEVGALSHAEVAAVIGCEVAKVKSLVFQARTALIERRRARETPCDHIRHEIATLHGGALRRSYLRHHLESCPGCREYREQVRRQRQMLALALPVIPSAALKHNVLAAVGLGGSTAAATGAGVGGGLAVAAKGGVAKIVIAALVAGGAVGGAAVVHNGGLPALPGISSSDDHGGTKGSGSSSDGARGRFVNGVAAAAAAKNDKNANPPPDHSKAGSRSASGSEHGFTPVQGESNGAAARQWAATRGKGKHLGITKTHHKRTRTRARRHGATHRHARTAPVTRTPKPDPAPQAQSTPQTQSTPTTRSTPQTETRHQPAPRTKTNLAPTSTTTTPTTAPASTTTTTTPTAPTGDATTGAQGGSNARG